jgi:NitT/TauT family transport system ATP-binding protein
MSDALRLDPLDAGHGAGTDTGLGLSTGTEVAIEVRDVSLRFDQSQPILDHIDLSVMQGEILVIIGPSGCGKSTLLNLASGVLPATEGTVSCFGTPIQGLNRRVAYMTQKDTLLPWRTAVDNAAMPLELKGVPRKERRERARAVLEQVGVGHAADKRPHQLSGGMRSRVSLARSLLSDADIFLMDEPFSAIDALQRVRLQQLLVDLWASTNKTMIYVTHDLEEAISLGHRVVVMGRNPGRIAVERAVEVPQPREVALFRNTAVAHDLYAELWESLERQFRP